MEEDSIIYVDADATDGEETGESWGDAYTDLQDALAVAGASDQIWVAEGTYVPTPTVDRDISFVIPSGVNLYGGFLGNETDLDQRDIRNNLTILSGNIGANSAGDNSHHVVNISNTVASTIIDGFTVTGGQANGTDAFRVNRTDGAAFSGRTNASATLSNLIITGNSASEDGGGIFLGDNSSPTIDSVSFINNSANDNGGAIHFDSGGNLSISNSLFTENQSQTAGAIYVRSSINTFNVFNSTFYNNEGNISDAIYDDSGRGNDTNIVNNIFWNNEVINRPQVLFDGIFIRGSLPEATNFSNNIIKGEIPSFEEDIDDGRDITLEGNVTDDPLFVDAEEGDFRLELDSPGVDAGNNDLVSTESGTTDVTGNPRIYTDEVDIGAYEYGLYLSIDDVRVIEGDEDTSDAEFTVTLSDSLNLDRDDEVTVEYTTFNRSARSGEDFERITGTLTFDQDTDTRTISVPINGDTRSEFSETFDVGLRRATGGAMITDSLGTGIIQNDDQLPAGTRSDRFFAPEVEASFYTPTAAEREEILDLLSDLNIDTTDGVAFFLEPTPADT
ncbi:MAG: Calx-beta domain-containing protein [Cyanobacteria bacterium J06631_2]